MGFEFGKSERVTCITPAKLQGHDGDTLCVAYKTTTYSFLAPAYLRDDGYVLRGKRLDEYWPMPNGQKLTELQASGELPSPLPPYGIPLRDYVFGNVLWLLIAGIAVAALLGHWRKRQRMASLRTDVPPGSTPLQLRTQADRWLHEQASRELSANEYILQQAYGYNAEETRRATASWSVVLTDQRLLMMKNRLSFGLLSFGSLENTGFTSFDREDISSVESEDRRVEFVFDSGSQFTFFVQWSERRFTNQRRFLSDVPRLFPSSEPETDSLVPAHAHQ